MVASQDKSCEGNEDAALDLPWPAACPRGAVMALHQLLRSGDGGVYPGAWGLAGRNPEGYVTMLGALLVVVLYWGIGPTADKTKSAETRKHNVLEVQCQHYILWPAVPTPAVPVEVGCGALGRLVCTFSSHEEELQAQRHAFAFVNI